MAARHFKRHARFRERLLRAHDALSDRGLGHQKCTRDFIHRQAAEQPKRQRDPRLGRQHRVAGGENQPQQIVADVVIESAFEVRHRVCLLFLDAAADLGVLLGHAFVASKVIVRKILGESDIADDSGQACNDFRGLDSPDGVDGGMGVFTVHSGPATCNRQPVTCTFTDSWRPAAGAALPVRADPE